MQPENVNIESGKENLAAGKARHSCRLCTLLKEIIAEGKRKHPRGLYTLFFTEMWERFSYYGMRALLVLFMVDAVATGGLAMDDQTATAIYGLYVAFVYLIALPGGWIADRLLGAQRSVYYGGIIIACGHFTLAIPAVPTFFIGLLLVVLGTGLLKPNVSAMVAQLYPEGGARRDAGFTIFYMGINLGAAIGPLICSTLGEKINWHYGFAAAGVGMVLGLVQYRLTAHHLGEAGRYPARGATATVGGWDRAWYGVVSGVAVVVLLVVLMLTEIIRLDPVPIAKNTSYVIAGLGFVYLAGVFLFGKLDATEAKRMVVLVILLIASAMFWSGFEQAGSSLNLFAARYTDRILETWGGFEIPAGWFQFLNPSFILIFSPVFAALWLTLARRHLNPSVSVKFGLGLILLGLGFLVMVAGAKLVSNTHRVLPYWLVCTYLLHTLGELCLSPVGLSTVTKLAPRRFVGQMMGMWFLATSLGNLIAGLFAGEVVKEVGQMPRLFLQVVLSATVCGVVLFLLSWPLKRLMGKIE